MTRRPVSKSSFSSSTTPGILTVQSNNAEDKDQRQNQNNNGVNLQARRLISVKLCASLAYHLWQGSISQRVVNVLSMVLLEPPAPAALVLLGRALATFSF